MHFNPQRLAIFKGANRGDCVIQTLGELVIDSAPTS